MSAEQEQEFEDYILYSEHEQIVSDIKSEYEEEIIRVRAEKDEIIRKLKGWGNDLQASLNSLSQELYHLRNVYPDVTNILKGQAKWAPDSLKNAIMLIDFLWAQYKNPWLMYKRIHEKRRRPLWQWGLFVVFSVTFGGIVYATATNPAGAGSFFLQAAPYFLMFAVIALIGLIFLRRRREKPNLS